MQKSGSMTLTSGTFELFYGVQTEYTIENDFIDFKISRCQNGIWEFTVEKEINKYLFITGFWEGKRNFREYYNKYDNWIKFKKYEKEMCIGVLLYDINKSDDINNILEKYKNKFGFFDYGIYVIIDFENAFLKNMYFYTDEDDVIYGFDIMIERNNYE